MAFSDYLRQTAVIKQLFTTRDANQGVQQNWMTTATVKCMVQPWSGGVGREDEKDGSIATHRILLSGKHSLGAKNQIHVDALRYNVLKCRDWNSIGHHTTVECVLETS